MKKLTTILLALLAISSLQAQVKIGENPKDINDSSILEMETKDKGMLLPRVELQETTKFAPLKAHVEGMTVYNTATAGDVTPGYYYNDGTKWVRIADASDSNDAEWRYDSNLDQVLAVRPFDDNNQKIFISPKGHRYNNVGNYDYANFKHSINTAHQNVPRWGGGDIKNKFVNVNFATSDALGLTTPYTSTPGYKFFGFNWDESIITNDHVANAYPGANRDYASSISYINADNISANGLGNLIGQISTASFNSTNSAKLGSLQAGINIADFFGSGNVGKVVGTVGLASFYGKSSKADYVYGGHFFAKSGSATTGNISNISGVNSVATHNGAGVVTNLRGGNFTTTNNSTSTGVIPDITGVNNTINHNGTSDVTQLHGFKQTVQTDADAGIPNIMRGQLLTTSLKTQKTGSGSTLEGMRNLVYNYSSVDLNQGTYGFTNFNRVNGTGISANIRGIQNFVFSDGKGTGNSSRGLFGISNDLRHTSTTNTLATLRGIDNVINVTGSVGSGSEIYGLNNVIKKNSTTGIDINNVYGNSTYLTISPTDTDNYANVFGIRSFISLDGQGIPNNIRGGYIGAHIVGNTTGTIDKMVGLEVNNQTFGARDISEFTGLYVYQALATASSGTVTNSYGIKVENIRNNGTLVNHYGLYMGNMPSSTADNFAIYTNSGKVRFGDRVETTQSIKVGMDTGSAPEEGMIRFNKTTKKFQGYTGTEWVDLH